MAERKWDELVAQSRIAQRIARGCPLAALGLQGKRSGCDEGGEGGCAVEWTAEFQQNVLVPLLQSERLQEYPLLPRYESQLLKAVMRTAEQQGHDVDEELYTCMGQAMSRPDDAPSYRHFFIQPSLTLVCQEQHAFVAKGTTGLRTWPAAQYFLAWARDARPALLSRQRSEPAQPAAVKQVQDATAQSHVAEGSSMPNTRVKVLELGCGTGLLAMAIAQLWPGVHVTATDQSAEALRRCAGNCQLNNISVHEAGEALVDGGDGEAEPALVTVRQLDWADVATAATTAATAATSAATSIAAPQGAREVEGTEAREPRDNSASAEAAALEVLDGVDVIVGADIVFDPAVVPSLVATIGHVLRSAKAQGRPCTALISSTIRNPSTYEVFTAALAGAKLVCAELPVPPKAVREFVDDLTLPILLCEISVEED